MQPLRIAMIGGDPGAFVGPLQGMAAEPDGKYPSGRRHLLGLDPAAS